MKAKSSKQSKREKASVQLNDLQPEKDAKGARGREVAGLDLNARMVILPGIRRG